MAASSRAVELAIVVSSDVEDAAADFDKLGSSAVDMASDIERASSKIDAATSRIDGAADATDNLASKSSQATGGLGALASGFELVGAEKYAGALQSAAMATDFFSGVGDIANLVLASSAVQTAKDIASKTAHAVATGAQTAATTAMTAAQWAFNAAMSANPVALIVIGLIALVAVIVLLYKKSETARRIIDAAFGAIQKAAGAALDFIKAHWKTILAILTGPIGIAVALIIKYRDKITGAFTAAIDFIRSHWKTILAILTGPIGLAVLAITKNWDKITNGFQTVRDKLGDAADSARETVVNAFEAMWSPVQRLIDLIQDVIDKIRSIPKPDIPGLDVPFIRAATPGATLAGVAAGGTVGVSLDLGLDTDRLLTVQNARARVFGTGNQVQVTLT